MAVLASRAGRSQRSAMLVRVADRVLAQLLMQRDEPAPLLSSIDPSQHHTRPIRLMCARIRRFSLLAKDPKEYLKVLTRGHRLHTKPNHQ